MNITIRPETETDRKGVWEVTRSAFSDKPYADGDEQDLIDNLRQIGALTVSLVAIDESELVGQITFSPATISSGIGKWFALGPVSVLPERQGEGIGGMLIETGMDVIEALEAWGCILTGDPEYYSRHGFNFAKEHCPDDEPEEKFMIRLVGDKQPDGVFAFHEAFHAGT